MKKVLVHGVSMKIPESFITAAYAGACAAHQVGVHENMFGKNKVDFHEHFIGNFQTVKETCASVVEELPPITTLKEIVSNSPANYEYGGF